MFVMSDPALEEKDRQQEYMLMESIIKEEKQELKQETQPVQEEEQDLAKVGTRNKPKPKPKGKPKGKKESDKIDFTTQITKKTQISKALKDFIPEGIRLQNDTRPSQDEYLAMEQMTEAPQFSLNFKTFLGKILRVTDGDTLKIAFKLSNTITRFNFRLNGVDTPQSHSGEVVEFGKYVKEVLRRMIEGKIVRVQAGEFDKYGRVLSRVYAFSNNEQFCVNDFLIQNDLAKPYEGKTKDQFTVKDYDKFKQKYWRTSWPQVIHYPRIYFKGNENTKSQFVDNSQYGTNSKYES